jgi:hypothetical protein
VTDGFTAVRIAAWPGLTLVSLYHSTLQHIAEEHAEFKLQLPSLRLGLEMAIARPSSIFDSTTNPGGSVVIASNAITYFGAPVRIPIRLVEGTSGRVVTAYFDSSVYSGRLLWSAKDE